MNRNRSQKLRKGAYSLYQLGERYKRKTIIILIFAITLFATTFAISALDRYKDIGGEFEAPVPQEDPLLVNEGLIDARFSMIKKLLSKFRYREAINELEQLRTEVPRKTSLFIDYYLGLTHIYIADSLINNLMDINQFDELVYRDEVDIIYHTREEQELMKKVVKAKGAYYTENEIIELEAMTRDYTTAADRELSLDKNAIEQIQNEVSESDRLQVSGVSVTKNKNKKDRKSSRVLYHHERAILYFNRLIGNSVNNPYREDAMIKKAEVFRMMGDHLLAVAEYDLFVRFFPSSKSVVDALIEKGNLLVELDRKKDALIVFEEIVDVYPENDRIDYVRLKIAYLTLMVTSKATDTSSFDEMRKKIELLEGFEAEIRKKEDRLRELDAGIK